MVAPYISRPQAEEFLQAFATALAQPDRQPVVFHIWGVGGVGKSTLICKVKEAHERNAQIAEVSFGLTEGIENPIRLMAKLYEKIAPKDGWNDWNHDPFWDRYNLYWDAIHQLETEAVAGKGAVGEEQIRQVKQLLKLGVDVAGTFFLSESTKAAVNTVTDRGVDAAVAVLSLKDNLQQLLQQHKATRRNKELQELLLEPLPKLTQAFAEALRQRAKQRPVILVLDTYEKAPLDIDVWLWRSFIGNTTVAADPVRIWVAGRHCILKQEGWRKLNQDLQAVYERHVNRFDLKQTEDYLQQIGITEADQIHHIFEVTKGLPYYLNWIRDQYQQGNELNFFQGNQEIVRLLLQGLNDTQKQVVQLAACCRWFDAKLIQFLAQQQGLDFQTAVDPDLNCFDWLINKTFVEPVQQRWRLDDVARDVFRLSLWQEDLDQFHQVHDLLAKRFEALSDQEVAPDRSPPTKYENPSWREARAEYLYHLLFTRQQTLQQKVLTHLLEARYLRQDEVIQLPFKAIASEFELANHSLLHHTTQKFLHDIRPAIEQDWAVLVEDPIDYAYNQTTYGISKKQADQAVQVCLGQIDALDGLAKFAALFYKSKRCPEPQRYDWLLKAKAQAEQIVRSDDPDFSSGLFLWNVGNALYELGRKEEAIASYDKAIEIKPDYAAAWNNRGVALSALGRHEEEIASYDKAIEIQPDDHEFWNNRGLALSDLGRNEEAIASYDKAIEFKPDFYQAWNNRGLALSRLGRYEEAIESFDNSLKIKSDNFYTLVDRADVLMKLERYEEAIADDSKATELKPGVWRYYYHAFVLLYGGQYESALESFDKAFAIETMGSNHSWWIRYKGFLIDFDSDPSYFFHFGKSLIYLKIGHYGNAANSLKACISSSYLYSDALKFFSGILESLRKGRLKKREIFDFLFKECPEVACRFLRAKQVKS